MTQTSSAGLRVNTREPQSAEVALFIATVAVRVLTGFDNRLLSYPKYPRPGAVITFCSFKNFFVPATSLHSTFYTSHVELLSKLNFSTRLSRGEKFKDRKNTRLNYS